MVAYLKRANPAPERSSALSRDLFHNVTPQQLDREARELAEAEATPPGVRARLEAKLVERLKTPADRPSWGPDWVRQGDRHAPKRKKRGGGFFGALARLRGKPQEEAAAEPPLTPEQEDDAAVISRNLEKSRQVWNYRPLYVAGAVVAVLIAGLAMFVDYQIIHGDVWTRALSNEFMQVPPSLQASVVFKSLQVIFAVLIVHFMLKITGVYGRNTLITAAFVLALIMIGSLGYLVAYNNMAGATSATLENGQATDSASPGANSIDRLFDSLNTAKTPARAQDGGQFIQAGATQPAREDAAPDVPKISQASLANADSWIWLAFASVIFFIVTTVAALYLQTVENNVRNYLIARDFTHRSRTFAQLHLLELADRRQGLGRQAA